MRPVGILGGTFDPVHNGHVRLALEVKERLDLDGVRLVPAPRPRLRADPRADVDERARLLKLAAAGCPGLTVDERELARAGPTYTVDTLEELRAELPGRSICLILGMDAFARLDRWWRWTDLCGLCHIVVAHRPGADVPTTGPVAVMLAERASDDPTALARSEHGRVLLCEAPLLDISASQIRALLSRGRCIRGLVPDAVYETLIEEELYG